MNKSYFAIIPASVRYDRRLTPNAKLLYGEITALCNEKGYCWAHNSYFAELYEVSTRSISKWINQLIEYGYIFSEITYKDGKKEIEARKLKIINVETSIPPMEQNFHTPIEQKFHTPMEQNFADNNTYNNNTYNNNTYKKEKNEKINVESFKKNQGVGFLGVDNLGLENQGQLNTNKLNTNKLNTNNTYRNENEKINVESFKDNQNKEAEKLPLYNQSQEDSVKSKIKSLDESEKIKKLIWQVVITNRHYMHRPITNEVLRILLDNLQKYSNGNEQLKIEILETATSAGYTTIYPLKNNLTSRNTADKTLDTTASYDINSYESEISENYENYLNSFMNKM